MKNYKRNFVYTAYIIFGTILFVLGCVEKVDEFWSGMGATLILMGVLRLLRNYRFSKNEEYRSRVEIELTDERNKFIRNKAWAWSGYLFILLAGVMTIVMKVAGQELLSQASASAVCLMLILYWISYMFLKRKY